jgi:hypothetical protein
MKKEEAEYADACDFPHLHFSARSVCANERFSLMSRRKA